MRYCCYELITEFRHHACFDLEGTNILLLFGVYAGHRKLDGPESASENELYDVNARLKVLLGWRLVMDSDKYGNMSPEAELLRRAEEQLREKSFEVVFSRTDAETQKLLHELRINQIELAMQNEELRRTQDELAASQSRYFDLYELSSIGYMTVSVQGLILKANPAAATMLGTVQNTLLNKPLSHFIFNEDQDFYYLHRRRVIKTNEADAWDMRLRRSDGSRFWAHLLVAPAHNGELWINFNDVTRRMESEIALRTSDKSLSMVLSASKMGVWEWNVQTNAMLWSPECFEIIGIEGLGVTYESFINALYLDDGHYFQAAAKLALEEKTLFSVEYRIIHSDGRISWLSSLAQPTYDEKGRPLRLIGTVQDITTRKLFEEKEKATIEILRMTNNAESTLELMRDISIFFKKLIGCDAVGVRLRDGDDFPLYETLGFSEEFLLFENGRTDPAQVGKPDHNADGKSVLDCMCGKILLGRYDSSKPFFTTNGSFWSSSFTELQKSSAGIELQAGSCNRCNDEGYESIALVPLHYHGDIVGLFQFNDRRGGRFTAEKILQLEDMVDIVSISLAKLRSDESLRRSEQSLLEAQEIACLGSYVYNIPDDRWTGTAMMYSIFGIDAHFDQSAAGLKSLVFHPQSGEMLAYLEEIMERKSTFDREYRIKRKNDGAERWVHTLGKLEYDATGSPIRMAGSLQDITARKQEEKKLLEERRRLAGIIEGTRVGTWEWEIQNGVVNLNERWADIIGYTLAEISPVTIDTWVKFSHPDDLQTSNERLEEYFRGESDYYEFEARMRHRDGSWIWVLDRGRVTEWAEDGKPLLMMGTHMDITERKQKEDALRESNEYLENLINYANAPIIVWDPQFRITRFNHAFEFITGFSEAEVLGQSLEILFPTEVAAQSMALICKTLTGERWETVEIKILHRDESVRTVLWNSATLYSSDGKTPIATIAQGQDITERKQAEQALFENIQMLQETRDGLVQFEKEAAVGRLVAGVAHELLNPVSIISSRLQFMADEILNDQSRDGLRICREQLNRVVKISQDLNQLSTIAPRPQVSEDLREVIALSLAIAERRILEERVCVVYSPPPEPVSVKMERDSLLKAMNHLLLNACDALLKTKHKRLIITVQTYPVSDKAACVRVTIADNGGGIADGDMNKLFDPFFTTKDPKKGTGLGLTICKNILATHRGKLRVENNDLGGASFIVELPLSDS